MGLSPRAFWHLLQRPIASAGAVSCTVFVCAVFVDLVSAVLLTVSLSVPPQPQDGHARIVGVWLWVFGSVLHVIGLLIGISGLGRQPGPRQKAVAGMILNGLALPCLCGWCLLFGLSV